MINIFMKKSKQVSESEETAKDVHDSKAVVKDDSLKRSKLIDIKVETPDDDEPEKKGLAKLFGPKKPRKVYSYEDNPHLLALRPHECYMFFSDYTRIDDNMYSCILAMFHNNGATDRFGQFWGLGLLPHNLPKTTKVIRFEQVNRLTDEWVNQHQTRSEKVAEANAGEQGRGGTNTTRRKAGKASTDLETIAAELLNGASYLHVHYRLQVLAPSLKELDAAIDQIRKDYIDAFSSLTLEPYQGEQKKEMSTLLRDNDTKLGTGFYYTSTEYAGSYSLVTHGIEDHDGEFVGTMTGSIVRYRLLPEAHCSCRRRV